MAHDDTRPDLPPDYSDLSFDAPSSETTTPGNPAVTPLFLSPKEKNKAEDHTPPGLSNPFWR